MVDDFVAPSWQDTLRAKRRAQKGVDLCLAVLKPQIIFA